MVTRRLADYVDNAASGTISGAVTDSALTCTMGTGSGLLTDEVPKRFAVWNKGVYTDATQAKLNGAYEVVKVTAFSGTAVTAMTRAQDSTSAIEWGDGWQWDCVFTRAMHDDIDTQLDNALTQNVNWIDPTDAAYGAAFNGSTDDTAAWTAAIAAANTAGKEIVCPAGTTIISNATVANGITCRIRGQGKGLTILKLKTGGTSGLFKNITTPGLVRFELHDLTIDANSPTNRDVRPIWLWTDYFYCTNVEFKNSTKAAISLVNIDNRAVIEDCWFHSMAVHNNVDSNGDTCAILVGKTVAGVSKLTVRDCDFEAAAPIIAGQCPAGVIIDCNDGTTQECLIEGNQFTNIGQELQTNSSAAIHCYKHGDNSTVRDNVFYLAAAEQIRWQKSDNVAIDGNKIVGEATSIAASTNAVIALESRSTDEINYRQTIKNNVVTGCSSFAQCLYVVWGTGKQLTDIEIAGNFFDDCDTAILLKYVTGSVRIHHNVLRNQTGASGEKVVDIQELDSVNSEPAFVEFSNNTVTDQTERCFFLNAETAQNVEVVVRDNVFENIDPVAGGNVVDVRFVKSVQCSGNIFQTIGGGATNIGFTTIAEKVVVDGIEYRQGGGTISSIVVYGGNGTPEGVVTADPGALYLDDGGGAGTTLYIKESGSASTTLWVAYGPSATHVGNVAITSTSGTITLGGDCELHRDGANVWGTGGSLTADVNLKAGTAVQIGADCEFHRDALNIIGTPDSLKVDIDLVVDGTTQLDGATTVNAALIHAGLHDPQSTTLILSSNTNGAVTITRGYHRVDTFDTQATGALATINGAAYVGQRVMFQAADSTHTITTNESGNIQYISTGGALDHMDDVIELVWNGTKWCLFVYGNIS